jgi:hypothetical protein
MGLRARGRRRLVAVFTSGIVVSALTSVAFACTGFRGSTIVSWVSGAGGGGTVTGFGGDGLATAGANGFCPGAGGTENFPTGAISLMDSAPATIQVKVAPFSCTASSGGVLTTQTGTWAHLTAGTYDVNLNNAAAFTTTINGGNHGVAIVSGHGHVPGGDCMDGSNGTPDNGVNIGHITVDSNGSGSVNISIPATDLGFINGSNDFSNICVTDSNGGTGSPQVPIIII